MPFKFAALDDAIVASTSQEPGRAASGGSHLLLSMAEMQGRKMAPTSAVKTPYASGNTQGHTKTHGSVPHFRSKHGVSLINPLSSTFDSTRGDSSGYLTTLSVLESGESVTNSYIAARSLDRLAVMRGNTTKTINNIDTNHLIPQTISRVHGNALSQRVPASLRVTPANALHPGLQTSSGDYQIPQSDVVREHLRSGHISSHAAAGTAAAAAANVAVQRHPVKVSLQLPSLQGTTINPTATTQLGSPQHLSRHAFPGAVMDRAVRSRMTSHAVTQKSYFHEPENDKAKPVKFHISPPQKVPMTLKQVIESIQTDNARNDAVVRQADAMDLEIHECNPNTEGDTLELGPDVLLFNNASTEFITQQAPTTTPSVSHVVEHRDKSPPMRLDDLEPLQGQKTPSEQSILSDDDICLSPAFKTLVRAPQSSDIPMQAIEPGILEPNKSSTALKLSSVADTRYSNIDVPESKQSPKKRKQKAGAQTSTSSPLRQLTASEKDGHKNSERPKPSKRLQSSTLSKSVSAASTDSHFLEHASLHIDRPTTSLGTCADSHRNATNPSSLQTFYCNASSLALPQINPTPAMDSESVTTCVAPTPLSVKELLRHKHGLGGVGKGTTVNIDPVVDIDVSIDTRASSMAPTVDLATLNHERSVCETVEHKNHSLSDSYLAASKHAISKDSLDWSEQAHKSTTCVGGVQRSHLGNHNQSLKPPDWAANATGRPTHQIACHATRRFNMNPTPMRHRPLDSASDRVTWTEGSVHTVSSLASIDVPDSHSMWNADPHLTAASEPELYAVTVHTTTLSSIFSSPLRSASRTKPSPLRHRASLYENRSLQIPLPKRRAASAPNLLQRCYVSSLMDDARSSNDSTSERVSIFYGTGLFKPITDVKLEKIRIQKPRSVAGSRADIQKCIQKLQDASKQDEHKEGLSSEVRHQSFSGAKQLARTSDSL